jgi:hypothetical protein
MLDAHPNYTLENGHGMFRNELLESDEKSCLDGYSTAQGCCTINAETHISAPDGRKNFKAIGMYIPKQAVLEDGSAYDVEKDGGDVRDQGHDEHEFGKLLGAPGSFEIFAAVEQDGAIDEKGEEVSFDKGCGDEGPRIEEEFAGYES